MTAASASDLQAIARFLARRDVDSLDQNGLTRTYDVLVLCGSAVLASLSVAASAFHDGVVSSILATGGIGHSTPYLRDAVSLHPVYSDVETAGRSEAAIFAEILHRHLAVPASAIATEEDSANCGQNAEFSLRVLADRAPGTSSVLLVQDPTMQRRTHACFDRHQRDRPDPLEVVSYAPFLPTVAPDGVRAENTDGPPVWTVDRFTSLALGEIRRLQDDEQGYGPRGAGFIAHVDIPEDVLSGYTRLLATVPAALQRR